LGCSDTETDKILNGVKELATSNNNSKINDNKENTNNQINTNNNQNINTNNNQKKAIVSVKEVAEFLVSIEVSSNIVNNFIDNEIDFQALKSLTDNELKEE
jgi:hypothetical protein